MEAKNLRIGNLVRSKINGISKVEQVGSSINPEYVGGRSFEGNYWENSYLPIELTAEWLDKFGCLKNNNNWLLEPIELSYITTDECFEFEYQTPNLEWRILQIKYVHELQNLFFAFTGTELNYKTDGSTCA